MLFAGGFKVIDAFSLVACEPVIEGQLGTAENLSDLLREAFLVLEQDELVSFSEGMGGSASEALFKFVSLLGRKGNGAYFAQGVFGEDRPYRYSKLISANYLPNILANIQGYHFIAFTQTSFHLARRGNADGPCNEDIPAWSFPFP